MADFDFTELKKLAADLGDAPRNVGPGLRSAMMKTAGDVKKDATDSVRKDRAWRGAASAIDYDVEVDASAGGSSLSIEVGYNKGKRGGPLGNLREFGAPNAMWNGKSVPLAPHNDLLTALEGAEPDFVRGIDGAVEDALKEVGL